LNFEIFQSAGMQKMLIVYGVYRLIFTFARLTDFTVGGWFLSIAVGIANLGKSYIINYG
jgi:hypothetical protein